jgi:hypothetical protein
MIDAATAAVSPASKQARWDHKPVNLFALSFTTQEKLGGEDSICVGFFFPPSPSHLPPALENAHAPFFFFFFWTAVAIHVHKNTKPEETRGKPQSQSSSCSNNNNNNNNVCFINVLNPPPLLLPRVFANPLSLH